MTAPTNLLAEIEAVRKTACKAEGEIHTAHDRETLIATIYKLRKDRALLLQALDGMMGKLGEDALLNALAFNMSECKAGKFTTRDFFKILRAYLGITQGSEGE